MSDKNSGKITMQQLLFPISLLSFTLMLLFAFQTTQVLRDRSALRDVLAQQEKPLEDSTRLLNQLKSIVAGTQKLSQEGNKNAKMVIDRLKELGVISEAPQQQQIPEANSQVPAASQIPAPTPIKP